MALSRKQVITALLCFAVMGAMLIRPPWFWEGDPVGGVSSPQFRAGYGWLWDAPPPPARHDWQPVIWWWRLFDQWIIVGVGMVLLLFLRESRERGRQPGDAPESPSDSTQGPTVGAAAHAARI